MAQEPSRIWTGVAYSPGGLLLTVATPVTANDSIFSVTSLGATNRSLRGGYSRTLATAVGCKLSALADVGAAMPESTGTGLALAGGGAVTCDLPFAKLAGFQGLFAARELRTPTGTGLEYAIGIGKSW